MGSKVSTRELVQNLVEEGYSIPQITKALRINRTYGYELIKEKSPKKRVQNDEASLRQKIQELCGMFPTNGYRWIRVWLQKKYDIHVNHKRVYRIMKDLGLLNKPAHYQAKRKKKVRKIPVSRSNEHFQVDITKITRT